MKFDVNRKIHFFELFSRFFISIISLAVITLSLSDSNRSMTVYVRSAYLGALSEFPVKSLPKLLDVSLTHYMNWQICLIQEKAYIFFWRLHRRDCQARSSFRASSFWSILSDITFIRFPKSLTFR